KKTMHEAQDYLREKGVNLDLSSAKETNGPLNGRELISIELDGTDENGPVTVTLGLLKLSDTKSLQLTYWGTKETQDNGSYQAVVDIVKSIKPAG
ncbi:MAG: Two component sensor kinase, partial [Rhizobium sp.]|nr:Two component sensor kinase [Rhizobium sp.]